MFQYALYPTGHSCSRTNYTSFTLICIVNFHCTPPGSQMSPWDFLIVLFHWWRHPILALSSGSRQHWSFGSYFGRQRQQKVIEFGVTANDFSNGGIFSLSVRMQRHAWPLQSIAQASLASSTNSFRESKYLLLFQQAWFSSINRTKYIELSILCRLTSFPEQMLHLIYCFWTRMTQLKAN